MKCMLSKAGVYDSRFVNILAAAGIIGGRDNRFLKTVIANLKQFNLFVIAKGM